MRLLETAWANFQAGERKDLRSALRRVLREAGALAGRLCAVPGAESQVHGAYYLEWPAELVQREPDALAQARRELARRSTRSALRSFCYSAKAINSRQYAHSKGVALIGDLPFFVSPDSSDVWANPELFLLDEHRRPRFVAGVPPDYFSAQGQLWGNPVYNWDALRATGYRWWIDRLRALLAHVDAIRLDHFRGFAAAWHVPAGAPTAQIRAMGAGSGSRLLSAVRTNWAACRSSPKIWVLLLQTCARSATNFKYRAHGFCSLPSTDIQTIHICRTTL